ncbi:DUF4097 domain-containing protein [Aureisphaera sp. CAU 1614]|uniref:DUF4097 domain-containing protein n=1 Tax=Halomarinibacterium sedimenti TaxID=2857106 RepID=A0A9X1JZC0_9FLAO|nr:DUF4097 family beta strand repeat-containing protein [Halomarinibacterium sedimenti]MBW2937111.1 DUF4097 domain-containing protein [Halomarinibacterium sedimenti]
MNKNGIHNKNINPIVLTWGFFLLLNLGFVVHGYSQKVIEKTWDANAFDKLEINSDDVFKIKIVTEQTSEIKLISQIEGENYENLNIGASEKGKTLTLKTTYRPYFKPKNDKLAAHKVISIEMILTIPESMEVAITAKIASLEIQGSLQKLDVNLRDGHCFLKDFVGNARLNTRDGDITVNAQPWIEGKAISKYGIIKNELVSKGKYLIKAESVNGNISLLKTRE